MKLVFATPTIAPEAGGPAFFVRDLAAALTERGYDVSVVTHVPEAMALNGDAPYRLVPTAAPKSRFGWTKRLHRCLAEEFADADVVFIHGIWQQMAMAAASEARRARVPYVMFPHGMMDPYIINRTRFHAVARWVQLRLYQARDLQGAAAVVFTTDPEMEKALTVIPELSANAQRIRYGTADPEIEPRFENVDNDVSSRPMTIGYLGRLHPKKNLQAAVRAMTAFDADEVCFEIVGPPSDHLAELQATVDELQLWDRVSFHPPVFDDQKFVLMRRWDWLILPSFQENFGQVLAQALSVGTPVIVSDRIDTCDAIVSAGAGIACGTESDDIQISVRKAQAEMRSDGSLEWRRSARAAFDEGFSFSRTIDDAVDLLSSLGR
jgi:glycosyltransferase involved in cell wall biosynthesis